MAGAVATERKQLVSKPTINRVFLSMRENLRLVHTARYPIVDAGGIKRSETKGKTLTFRNNRLDVSGEGTVRTETGEEWDVSEALAWLASHRLNGDRVEGFWEVEPAAPPISPEEMKNLYRCSPEDLAEMRAQEAAGYDRKELLDLIDDAIAAKQGK